ncbi:MAG: hypothetical protein VX686_02955 [Candidatus Thermoplasmatota archaeon]|nr:hypothetical protein [Candidatus Thermoplasmatota archaeon]MEC9354200.1 hypothetical protein [Candidatus Thermoplasmatota archaeon]MEE3207378.1 hypothetical protein [Candidatus Thermoplasmatota archaeon]
MSFFRICASTFFGLGVVVGMLLFISEQEYIIPASGQSLSLPCAFAFWTLAVIFWAVAHDENDT